MVRSADAPDTRLTPLERRAAASLAGVSSLRMLGLFIVLPVLALHADTLPGGHDPSLIGLAIGAYGLAQALLQLPFGWASDRIGRKPAIAIGLALLAAGSFLAAWAPTMGWLIAGRTLQGAGAVSAAVIALAADLTREEVRSRAMAGLGIAIGATFAISMVAGPALAGVIGVPGLFVLTGALALAAIPVVAFAVPAPPPPPARYGSLFSALGPVLADRQLLRFDFGIFVLHAILTSLFVQVPFALRDAGLETGRQWMVYLPVIVLSLAIMFPLLRTADRDAGRRRFLSAAVAALALSIVVLAFAGGRLPALVAGLVIFFAAFNVLEAALPSMVARFAPATARGTATGVFSSSQFLGIFVGGALGGLLLKAFGPTGVYAFGIALALIWLWAGATMGDPPPAKHSSLSMGRT